MANGGNINYNVRFNADTSGLNRPIQEIQRIQKSLKAVQRISIQFETAGKTPEEIQQIIRDLTEAKNAAKLVETALKKSFSAKLNTFNITNFNNELKKSGTNITEIGQKLMKSGAVGAAAFRNIENQIGKVNLQVKQSNKLFDEMATTMMNSIKWGITSSIWNNMTGSIEKAWGFAKKLDSSLNDIRIVTDKSAQDMEKFAVQANKAAKSLGSSTTGYTEASLIYYQQGLSDAEVQARTETTLKAANVTGQSAAEVSEQLTAVWNGYKVSAQEAELYVDKLSAVAATTAADLEELSTGMSKVASAANIMGVDIDQLNAQLATVVSVTRQAPESVGTAFKTIYARMGDIEAGLDTETSLGEYTKEMSEMGFNVLDANGKLKDMGSVIEEIGGKWQTLSREQQVALSQIMAGTRQYNNLLALFDNWDEYTESLETSRNAAGSLQKQQDTYMESMEAHLQKLSTEGERVYNNLFDANAVNPLIDALTSLVSLLADFVDGIGGIGPILLMLGSIGTKTFSKQLGEGISTSVINFKNAKKNAEELASQYQILDSISKNFSDDLVGQQAAIDKSINSLARQGLISQERADELRAFSSALGEAGNRIDELKIKQEEYNKVAKEGKENAQQLDIEHQGDSDYVSTEGLLEQISAQRQKANIEKDTDLEDALPAYRALNKELNKQSNNIEQTRNNLTQLNSALQKNIDENIDLSKIIKRKGKTAEFKNQVGDIDKSINDIAEQYKKFDKDLSDEEKEKFNKQLEEYQKQSTAIRGKKKGGNLSANEIKAFQDAAQKIQKMFAEAIAGGINQGLDDAEGTIEDIRSAAKQAAEGSLEQNQNELNNAEEEAEGLQQDFNDEIANEQLKQRITLITELVGAVGELASAMQMVSNIVNIAMDDSLSVEEKIKQIIPLVIAAVPIVISGFKGLQASLAGLFPSGVAAAGGLAAAGTASAAAGTAATGAAGAFTALWTAMGPIGWIILGVAAAIAGLTVIINLATNAYNADAIAAEKAAKAYEEATQAVTEANTAYENLKNTIESYDSAVDKLKTLAQGTDAFTEALEEANKKAAELINTYNLLPDQYYKNAKGLIVFNEGVLESIELQEQELVATAKRQEILAARTATEADAKSRKTNVLRNIRADSQVVQLSENQVADTIIKSIAGIINPVIGIAALGDSLSVDFDETKLDDVISAINENDLANGKLTDAVLDSLPYSDRVKQALKENQSSIEDLAEINKQLIKSEKSDFENLIRQSLQGEKEFNQLEPYQQNLLVSQMANQYGSFENFKEQNNFNEILAQYKNKDIEELASDFAKLKGKDGYEKKGSGVQLKTDDGDLTEVVYTKDEMALALANEASTKIFQEIMPSFFKQVFAISQKETQLLGRDTGLLSQFAATGIVDISNLTSKEYNKIIELLDAGNPVLEDFFNNLDLTGTSFKNTEEALNSFKSQLKEVNIVSILNQEKEQAEKNIQEGNAIIDKLLKGDSLSDSELTTLSSLQAKYESLQGIWVEELWYKQENITKLKAVLEIEEDIVSSTNRAAAAWQRIAKTEKEFEQATLEHEEIKTKNQTTIDSRDANQGKFVQENWKNVSLDELREYQDSLPLSNETYYKEGSVLDKLKNRDDELWNVESDFYKNLISEAGMEYSEQAATTLYNQVDDWINQQFVDGEEALSLDRYLLTEDFSGVEDTSPLKAFKQLQEEYNNAIELEQKLEEEIQTREKIETDSLDARYKKMVENEEAIKTALTADLEIRIANKEDLLTNVDNVIDRASNIKTAIESIGDGFKVAADKSDELLRIFPELAAGAKVLSDGTIELNELTVDSVLDGEADILDADRNKTVTILQNRIKELDLSIEADKKQLEAVQNTAASEFNIQDYLNDTYKDFTSDEIKADTTQAQTEIANDGISTKAIINNWEQKSLAAAKYAEIAAAAISDPASVAGKSLSFEEYQANVKIDADFSSSENTDLTDEEKEKQIEERNARLKKQFEDYLQQRIDLSEQERAEYLLAISDIYSSQNDIATATQKNIDLLKDEIDRYHDINIQLDDIAKKIERINKAQEHLVGADLIASQKQSLKLLKEEIELRRQKQEIQQAEAVELQGHLLADGVKFNEDGSVANYAEVMKKQMNIVIAAQKSGNEEAAKVAEKNYEAFKKNFERYEELRDNIEDLADEITDMMYEQISKKVEVFTAKLNVKLDTAQAQKEWKEFTNQLFISANDALSQITAQSDLLKSDRSIASKATNKYDKIVNEGMKAQALVEGTAEKGTKSVYATYSKELGKYIFDQAKWQEDMEAAQQEAQDSILQIIDDVDSLGETAIGLLEDTIAAQKEQLAIYDDMSSLLNHAMKLQELFVGEEDYDSKAKMYEEQAKVASEKTRTAKERRQYALDNIDSYAEAYKEAKQKYDEAKASGEGDVTTLEKQLEITKQAYEDMKNELKESTEDFYTSIEEQIEIAKNAYINTINKALADMENKMTGGKGLSYISDEWDLINKNADRYLDTVNSTYEVQSLEAKYRKAIDSTSSISAQKKLNKAMEEELKALQEKDKLSQYDIDRANKKLDITMKQIALEEAQANKSTMRLRRDSQGNYSYQFVADEDGIAKAQQDLLAAQNDLYNFDKERYQQTLDDALAAYQEYQQKMLEAAQINDPEKRAEMEKLITEQYQEYLLAITADNEVAKQNLQNSTMEALQGMYDVNSENFDIMTKGMFEDFKDADGNIKIDFQNLTETELSALMGNLVTGWDGSVQSMIDKIADSGPDGFKAQSKSVFETAQEAAKILDDTLKTLGENFSGEGNTADKILDDVTEINDKMDAFKKDVLDPTVDKGKEELPDAWATYKTGVEKATKAIKKLSEKLTTAYTKASDLAEKLRDIASQSPINVDVNYNTTGNATAPSGGYSPSGGGGGGGNKDDVTPPKTEEDNFYGDYPYYLTEKKPNFIWEGINDSASGFTRPASNLPVKPAGMDASAIERGGWKDFALRIGPRQCGASGFSFRTVESYNGDTAFIAEGDIKKLSHFDTGGYTGEWGAEGRMAMLHEKEIVLNKQDTANILNAVSIVRGIGDLINNLSANLLSNLSQRTIDSTLGMRDFEQNVHITAEFPNVSSSSEIEDALRNLTNVAAQRAFNTRI